MCVLSSTAIVRGGGDGVCTSSGGAHSQERGCTRAEQRLSQRRPPPPTSEAESRHSSIRPPLSCLHSIQDRGSIMSQHSVTVIRTTASSSNVQYNSPGLIDRSYPRSSGATLKLCQALCLLIAFLCVRFSDWTDYSAYRYFEVVTICFMILIIILYVVNLFRIYRMLTCVSWPLAELLHYSICTFLLLIASIVAAVKSYGMGGLVAGSIFGFIASFLCIVGMVLSYKVTFVTQSSGATL
ncbi:CKLF-like MARVEL transmembrane domain-containing protein 7 isoform X1 [Hyla sarda]|uniref:CKLF-like MARVEL transmembrane domain-containing protein 7 isoform X1 n=1 Tax=Hyla sarda TaxID=327740 RepID=UPI0024C467BD|nr:CKLF-like MARVEL transmembrane domain-containing protein 7 isoform X1 [Hyla sarda]